MYGFRFVQFGWRSTIKEAGEAISEITDLIMQVIDNIGESSADVLDGGLNMFSNFVNYSIGLITKNIDDAMFDNFWQVIDNVTSVLGVVASTLLVILFLINLCTDTWENRHDIDLWDIVKMIMKMFVSVVLVNNALLIVKSIFNLGVKLSSIIFLGGQDVTLAVPTVTKNMLRYGICGFDGLLNFLICLLCSIAIIACGAIITMEILQRVFKIYVLVPFSSISFTTFVMGNGNRGNEIFRGYLKSVISTASEALVIMVCVSFTFSIAGDMKLMDSIMGNDASEMNRSIKEITISGTEEFMSLLFYLDGNYPTDSQNSMLCGGNYDTYRQKFRETLGRATDLGEVTLQEIDYNDTEEYQDDFLEGLKEAFSKEETVWICPRLHWMDVLKICASFLLPCALCCAAVKKSEQIASMIFGH